MFTQNHPFLAQRKGKARFLAGLIVLCALGLTSLMVPRSLSEATAPAIHEAPSIQKNRLVRLGKRVAPPKKVEVASTLLPVVRQKDIKSEHQILADQVLRALPSTCRDNLKNFYVNYEPGAARGLGGASTIIITGSVPAAEFIALLVHECGHVVDLGGLQGTPASGASAFADGSTVIYNNDPSVAFYSISWENAHKLKVGSKESDSVSGYALSDAFENFAETFAFYALQEKEFKRLAETNAVMRAKYEFMRDTVFAGTPTLATGKFVRGTRAPWDITLLPYEWHAKK